MNTTLSLQKLFNDRIFCIPEYQRGYAWEKQQVEEFLDDLALLDSTRHHYTGTVVLLPFPKRTRKDSEGTTYIMTDIVDGQQRLTTTVLLLNEMSRALKPFEGSKTLAKGIKKTYVQSKDIDGQPLYKMSLNDDTDDFFKDNVLPDNPGVGGPPVESSRRLMNAKNQIVQYLNEAEGRKGNTETWLRELHTKVTMQLQFNLYEVESEAEVGIIFEVMNGRGRQLTDLEKVKNYLLYAASSLVGVAKDNKEALAKSVNDAWGQILRKLMDAGLSSPASENQLLRSHWLLQYDHQSRHWQGSKSIKRRFDLRPKYRNTELKEHHSELLKELRDYVQKLRQSRTCFCDALSPDRAGAFAQLNGQARIRDAVVLWNKKLLRIERIATFLPLLMAVRMRWPTDLQKYLNILMLCEVLAFRTYIVARYYANYRQPAMFKLANKIARGLSYDDTVREIKRKYSSKSSRKKFDEFTKVESLESRYDWAGLRYFLYEYEQHLAINRGGSPRVDWADLSGRQTIEHILPQSIKNRPYWQDRFDVEEHQEYKHDIGNLTLTMDNSFLGNKSFPDKKGPSDEPCYSKSLLLQENELTRWDDWNTDAIDKRRAILLGWAKKRWHIDFSERSEDTYAEEPGDEENEEYNLSDN